MLYIILAKIINGAILFLKILSFLIIVNALLSWLIVPTHTIRIWISRIVDPLLKPFKAIVDRLGRTQFPFDISSIIAFITIGFAIKMLQRIEVHLLFLYALSIR